MGAPYTPGTPTPPPVGEDGWVSVPASDDTNIHFDGAWTYEAPNRFAGAEGKENGGFLQVAGATYEIHTDIPNTVQTDDKNVWIGSATGTPRVQNVKIYDRANSTYVPLDENKTYALAGMNYTLRNLGDGFAMFDGAELIKDYVSEDYLVMSTYAMIFDAVNDMPVLSSANSPLASYPGYLLNYENPYGAGRIQVV